MKYAKNSHVRMILVWAGMLGFDTYHEAESAILKDPEWYKTWDTSDWKVDDVTYICDWKNEQLKTIAA